MIRPLLVVFVLFIGQLAMPLLAQPVEICNNAIDDDGDGLADQNDPDCFCPIFKPVSLIPNPSFEDKSCCPESRSQIECVDFWVQASAATTDYIHTCRFLGADDLAMPLPVPDGEGAIGFRDGRFDMEVGSGTNTNPFWKEYAGACLTGPLLAGVSYRLQFYIGFTYQPFSPDINVTIFGTTNCDNIPFGGGDVTFGCPSNSPDWVNLGSVVASGTFRWLQTEIDFESTEDIYAIAIGPDCPNRAVDFSPYYFFDDLILAEKSAFQFKVEASDELCTDNLSLEIPNYDSLNYQWFKDGIALLGETKASLKNPPGDGDYHVVLESSEGCVATQRFVYEVPRQSMVVAQTICQGEDYSFGNQKLSEAGVYWDTLKAANNCDSIIELDLSVEADIESNVFVKIFPSEKYNIGSVSFDEKGTYQETIMSTAGCDSTVYLTLDYYTVFAPNVFTPNDDGINDYFTISGGEDLVEVKDFMIFDKWGGQVFVEPDVLINQQGVGWNGRIGNEEARTGVYLFNASLLMDDGQERVYSGSVTLVR